MKKKREMVKKSEMKKLMVFTFFVFSFVLSAQEKDTFLPKADEEFDSKKYADAEANYRISQSKFPEKNVASYNLGNAIYRQNQFSESKWVYANVVKKLNSYDQKHKAFHNLGNTFMKEKNYTQAVEAYKNALRNNPEDEETRYNFALAKKMLKENPPKKDKKQKKDKNKKDKKDQNKDKKNKEGKNKDKTEKKENSSKNNGQPKPNPSGISQQRVQNLLDAVNNEENRIQHKVNAQKVKGTPTQTDKDW